MEAQDRSRFRRIIEDQTAALKEDIAALKKNHKPISPDKAIGRLSRLEAMNDKAVKENSIRKAEARLRLLEAALVRVGSENYGLCLRCEEPIPEKRLEVLPETTLCMDCIREG